MTRTLLTIVDILYYALWILMLARVVLSWVNIGGYQVRDLVFRLTEPILAPLRRVLPATAGIDLSPMVVLFGAMLIRRILVQMII